MVKRQIEIFISKVYLWYTMTITTIKLKESTKLDLKDFRAKSASYDEVIRKLISNIKSKNLKEELINGYKESAKSDLESLKEWENVSTELD